MPYRKEKNPDGSWRVVNADTGDVKAKSTTEEEADKQIRLLHGVDHGMKPRHKAFGHG